MAGPNNSTAVLTQEVTRVVPPVTESETTAAQEVEVSTQDASNYQDATPVTPFPSMPPKDVTPPSVMATPLANLADSVPPETMPAELQKKLPDLRSGKLFTFRTNVDGYRLPRFTVAFHVNAPVSSVEATFSDYNNWADFMPLFQSSKKTRKGTKIIQSFKMTLPGGSQLGVTGLQATTEIKNGSMANNGWHSVFKADAANKVSNPDAGYRAIRKQRGSITVYQDPSNPNASVVYYEILSDPDIEDGLLNSGKGVITKLTTKSVIDLATHVASRTDNPSWVKSQTPTVQYTAQDLGTRGRMQ